MPLRTDGIPPLLMISLHCAEYLQLYWRYPFVILNISFHRTDDIPPMCWIPSIVLKISTHRTDNMPLRYWLYPSALLNIVTALPPLYCTYIALENFLICIDLLGWWTRKAQKARLFHSMSIHSFQSKHLESLLQCSETNEIADNLPLSWLSIWSFINPTVF